MLFAIISTMLFSIDEATTVVCGCWNRRKQYWQNKLVSYCCHCCLTSCNSNCWQHNIVHSWQHNIAVHACWQLATGNNPVILTSAWIPCVTCPKISVQYASCPTLQNMKYIYMYVDIYSCLWEYNNDIYLVYIYII